MGQAVGDSGNWGQTFDIGDYIADLRIAEAVGSEEGHKAAFFRLVGIGIDARENCAQAIALAYISGIECRFLVAWERFGSDTGIAVWMARMAGRIEELFTREAIASFESWIDAGFIRTRGDGLGREGWFRGNRLQIGSEVELLLSSEFGFVVHIMDHAG